MRGVLNNSARSASTGKDSDVIDGDDSYENICRTVQYRHSTDLMLHHELLDASQVVIVAATNDRLTHRLTYLGVCVSCNNICETHEGSLWLLILGQHTCDNVAISDDPDKLFWLFGIANG